ncbi:hypothetical protein, partial [Natronospira sp.]
MTEAIQGRTVGLALAAAIMLVTLLPAKTADANEIGIAAWQYTQTVEGRTAILTGANARWLSRPGHPLGNGWRLQHGFELGLGRAQIDNREQSFLLLGGHGRLIYPDDGVGFYAQAGVGTLIFQSEEQRPEQPEAFRRLTENDTSVHIEVGLQSHRRGGFQIGYR